MSAHTPGPWSDDCIDHDTPLQNIRIVQGNRTVCTVWIDDAPCHDYNAEQRANARLIAAAPDLLAALRDLVANLEEHDERNREPECGVCLAVAAGCAAIAKAEGRS